MAEPCRDDGHGFVDILLAQLQRSGRITNVERLGDDLKVELSN